ncbi:MAG: DegV family protein [Candidatus Pacebacteria bacterium]|nr:DegV family protein [Candidatus Paceibacterota bacterium]
MEELTQKQLQKMILFSCERIERDKEEINKINVFPVPDQDTGSNLNGTLRGVKEAIFKKSFQSFKDLGEAVLEGALMAAQGNTGIIYTGFMVGFFDDIKEDSNISASELSLLFQKGYERAKDSVQDPKKGTILDVMEAFAQGMEEESKKSKNIVNNFEKALKKAHKALLETPNNMPLLKKAGVVDAGGLGFLMILETYYDVLVENENPFSKKPKKKIATTKRFIQILTNRYEVVALMREVSLSEDGMREKLNALGDCLDIILVGNRAKIHIHTDDPYIVRDIIRTFGEEETMRIEDMAREVVGEESVAKNLIGLVIDEASGLNEKNIQHYQIESIPYKIDWNGIESLKGESLAEKLKTAKEEGFKQLPEVKPIEPKFFKEAFEKQLKTFKQVICVTSSNDYFNAYDSAILGRELLGRDKDKVEVIDSHSIGAGQAIVVLRAIDLINEQMNMAGVIEEIKDLRVNNVGVINSPYVSSEKNYEKIKKIMEKNKFVLVEANEKFNLQETVKKDECVDKIVNKVKKDLSRNRKSLAVILHNDNINKAKELKDQLKQYNVLVSFTNLADPVMSLKMGYKGLMISYIKL